jgi:hypothetical protein
MERLESRLLAHLKISNPWKPQISRHDRRPS